MTLVSGVVVAEVRRRKFLELYPEEATNEDPVLFRSSIIPSWAWVTHSHLPEAELLNVASALSTGSCMISGHIILLLNHYRVQLILSCFTMLQGFPQTYMGIPFRVLPT